MRSPRLRLSRWLVLASCAALAVPLSGTLIWFGSGYTGSWAGDTSTGYGAGAFAGPNDDGFHRRPPIARHTQACVGPDCGSGGWSDPGGAVDPFADGDGFQGDLDEFGDHGTEIVPGTGFRAGIPLQPLQLADSSGWFPGGSHGSGGSGSVGPGSAGPGSPGSAGPSGPSGPGPVDGGDAGSDNGGKPADESGSDPSDGQPDGPGTGEPDPGVTNPGGPDLPPDGDPGADGGTHPGGSDAGKDENQAGGGDAGTGGSDDGKAPGPEAGSGDADPDTGNGSPGNESGGDTGAETDSGHGHDDGGDIGTGPDACIDLGQCGDSQGPVDPPGEAGGTVPVPTSLALFLAGLLIMARRLRTRIDI